MRYSFEYFPPNTKEQEASLNKSWDHIPAFDPPFISLTYGAQGANVEKSLDLVQKAAQAGFTPIAHIITGRYTLPEFTTLLDTLTQAGAKGFVVLRGDTGTGAHMSVLDGIAKASEYGPVFAGGYPTPHPNSLSPEKDIFWLKEKINAGASHIITQFDFTPQTYITYQNTLEKNGIHTPVIPGILPFHNWKGITRFAQNCGLTPPDDLNTQFNTLSPQDQKKLADHLAQTMLETLQNNGFNQSHIYTMNKPSTWLDFSLKKENNPIS